MRAGGGHVWQGVCVWRGGMHGRGCAWHGGMHGTGGHAWQGCGMPPPPCRYYEIRSMIGRYASYWNAFLSHIYFMFYLTSRLYNLFTRFRSQMKRCLVLNFFFFLKFQKSIVSEKHSYVTLIVGLPLQIITVSNGHFPPKQF